MINSRPLYPTHTGKCSGIVYKLLCWRSSIFLTPPSFLRQFPPSPPRRLGGRSAPTPLDVSYIRNAYEEIYFHSHLSIPHRVISQCYYRNKGWLNIAVENAVAYGCDYVNGAFRFYVTVRGAFVPRLRSVRPSGLVVSSRNIKR